MVNPTRFASAARSYRRGRQPYPPTLFAETAQRIELAGHERLLDLAAGVRLELVLGDAENPPVGTAPFDVVAIGRARHWLERRRMFEVFDRLLGADGEILFCSSETSSDNPWKATFREVLEPWKRRSEARKPRMKLSDWLAGSAYAVDDRISMRAEQPITIEDLVTRARSQSSTSDAVLGAQGDEMCRALRAALAPYFSSDGAIEIIEAEVRVVRRSARSG
jgi:hypothetical protein